MRCKLLTNIHLILPFALLMESCWFLGDPGGAWVPKGADDANLVSKDVFVSNVGKIHIKIRGFAFGGGLNVDIEIANVGDAPLFWFVSELKILDEEGAELTISDTILKAECISDKKTIVIQPKESCAVIIKSVVEIESVLGFRYVAGKYDNLTIILGTMNQKGEKVLLSIFLETVS